MSADLKEALRAKLSAGYRVERGQLADDAHLFTSGLVDSLAVVDLVTFIEARIGRAVPAEAVTIENFDSIAAIAAFVARLTGQDGGR